MTKLNLAAPVYNRKSKYSKFTLTSGKLLSPMYQTVQSWEGSHRCGIALSMRHTPRRPT